VSGGFLSAFLSWHGHGATWDNQEIFHEAISDRSHSAVICAVRRASAGLRTERHRFGFLTLPMAWTLSSRYDFTAHLCGKFDRPFIDGTAIRFSSSEYPNLQPATRLTVAKLGFSF
jgi:hypothetical protein